MSRELTPAEHQQRVEAARSRWRDRGAAAVAGAAGAVAIGAGVNRLRRTIAAGRLKHGKENAAAITAKAERNIQRHAAAAGRIERQLRSDWPLPAWRRHLGRESRLLDQDIRRRMEGLVTPEDVKGMTEARMRLDTRMQAAALPRPIRDIGRAGGGFFVAGQRRRRDGQRTVIPDRLAGDLDARLAEGWKEPRHRGARQPLLFPTGDDLARIRQDVRDRVEVGHRYFTESARAKASRAAGAAAAEGMRGARAVLRRLPKLTRGRLALLALGGAAAGLALGKATRDEIDAAARLARAPRSAAEAEAGTYRKGHIRLHGMGIAIETPRGAWRRGADRKGNQWATRMPAHYGYVKGSLGADGDQVDVYLGPAAHDPDCPVFVIDQHKLNGAFDEHKAVLGVRTKREALAIYDAGFSDGSGPRRRRAVTAMSVEEFRSKALNGRLDRPLAKVDPTDPTDPIDEGAFGREPIIEEPEVSQGAPPSPRIGDAEESLSRRLARLFRSWLESPRRVGDEAEIAEALRGPLERAMLAGVGAAQIPPTTGGLPGVSDPDRVLAFSFERRNPEVQRRLEQYSLNRIRAISTESREAIRAAVIAGAQMGLPIDVQARRIRESVGLSPGQVGWVTSYRIQLETLDPRVLGRALRDRRHDGPIERAISTGVPIPAADIDRYVQSYQRRVLAYRATTIARTEALRGANTGMVETARVALLSMPDMTVEKTWIATKDERTRDAHRELDGKTVLGLDTPFEVDGKPIRWPHDDQASADLVVNCRCTFGLRLVPKPGAGRLIAEAA